MKQQKQRRTEILSEKPLFQGKWFGISEISYSINNKIMPPYETAYRPTTKARGLDIDGVEVIPIIRKSNQKSKLVLIANFRAAAGNFCLEFPAGMVENTNIEQNALRELTEQTGYIAERLISVPSPLIHCDPWKSPQTGPILIALINGDDPNCKKEQDLERQENIRVYTIPLDDNIPQAVFKLMEQNKYLMHSKIWAFCLGFSLNKFMI